MSRPLGDALSLACNALTNGRLPANALAEGERQALARRADDLARALSPASPERIRIILATIADMPSRTEEDRAKLRFALERDVADLSEFPEWALAAAARAYRKREVGDDVFRPTTGQLAVYCRQRTAAAVVERRRIAAVLTAEIEPPRKPIEPARRAELAAALRAFGEKLAASPLTTEKPAQSAPGQERALGAGEWRAVNNQN